jgi:hypothetical protein
MMAAMPPATKDDPWNLATVYERVDLPSILDGEQLP